MLRNFFIRGPPEALEMDLSQEGPDQTFDPLHEINWNFQGLLSKKVVLLGKWAGSMGPSYRFLVWKRPIPKDMN